MILLAQPQRVVTMRAADDKRKHLTARRASIPRGQIRVLDVVVFTAMGTIKLGRD